jgi:hypothetical protein
MTRYTGDSDSDTEIDDNNTEIEKTDEEIMYESVYFKYCFDGCKTIDDILYNLDGLKQLFEQWKHEFDTGYCFIDKILKINIKM